MRWNFLYGGKWFFEDPAILGEPATTVWDIIPFSCILRAFVGSFPFDECAFTLASRATDFAQVGLHFIRRRFRARKISTRYYTPEIHVAATVIPDSMQK